MVIYQDEYLVAVDKPSGLLSVPGKGPQNADCLAVRIERKFPGARIVHRLDQDTSGVMVLGLDENSHRELSRQFEKREVRKTYEAIVNGNVKEDSGQVDLPMRKDMDRPPRHRIDHVNGKNAVTDWHVIKRLNDRTRLELKPLTGRSHQLRLHMKSIGHPILGDDLYAPADVIAKSNRLLLHATSLMITHPITRRPITFESQCPF